MKFKTRLLDLEALGKLIVVLNADDARELGTISSDRVKLKTDSMEVVAIVNTTSGVPIGTLGVFKEVQRRLHLKNGDPIEVKLADRPESLNAIREKIHGERLVPAKYEQIVEDVVENHLSEIELAAFITALEIHGMSMEENEALSKAMIRKGKTINFHRDRILDKHSIGGVPGDKTTLIVVPIIASAGYTIPKSSSRAITSPAGTADRMEAICPVNLRIEEIMNAVDRTGACIVWGGALDLAPADDLFIQVEYPLSIDPLLLPSILSKKKAMGSTHVVIDIPIGKGTKIKTLSEARQLAEEFIVLGSRLEMHIECAVTEGNQPIGKSIGPNLEAREALETLMGDGPQDLIDKATSLAGMLFEMVGEKNGKAKALDLLKSGKAMEKMRQIIEAQGGNPDIKPKDIILGSYWVDINSTKKGRVLDISNRAIANISRAAGAPGDKKAGIRLYTKLGDEVSEGDPLFRIYSDSGNRLEQARILAEKIPPLHVGEKIGEKMLISQIKGVYRPGEDFILVR